MLYPIPTSGTSILGTFSATLFALLNPLSARLHWLYRRRFRVRRWLALFISITVLGFMFLFICRDNVADFFGITIDAFRVAGGILLLIGIRTVASDPTTEAKDLMIASELGALCEADLFTARSSFPLPCRCPIGPGVIATLILYTGVAWEGKSPDWVAVTVGISLTFVILLSGGFLRKLLGDVGLSIATRTLGSRVASIWRPIRDRRPTT